MHLLLSLRMLMVKLLNGETAGPGPSTLPVSASVALHLLTDRFRAHWPPVPQCVPLSPLSGTLDTLSLCLADFFFLHSKSKSCSFSKYIVTELSFFPSQQWSHVVIKHSPHGCGTTCPHQSIPGGQDWWPPELAVAHPGACCRDWNSQWSIFCLSFISLSAASDTNEPFTQEMHHNSTSEIPSPLQDAADPSP